MEFKEDISKVIYDASVLVSGRVSGNIHKTGLYRVSFEVLSILSTHMSYKIYLFDVFNRERELRKYVHNDFPGCSVIKVYSYWYRILFFPVGNLIDKLRLSEQESEKGLSRTLSWILKNILILFEKAAKKIDKSIFHSKNLNKEINKCDLYYSTYFPVPEVIRLNKKLKKVYTIHDLIPIIHPEYFSSPFNQKLVQEVVDNIESENYVICVSESTKNDLLKYRTDLNPNRVVVALLAAANHFYHISDEEQINKIKGKYNIPFNSKYLLSVCTIEPRKNLKTILASFKIILQESKIKDLVLVLTGSPGWGSEVFIQEINELNEKYNDSIILTGFVTDADLSALYSSAYAFIYVPLYEGFGLPPLEAMQCGTPVISSNSSSLPEVIGDSGIMIDPVGLTQLTGAIALLYENISLRNKLAQKSLKRASSFQWSKTVGTIENVLQLALEDNG